MVLLELKAWGLLKEHGSKVDLLPQEAGPQKMSLQKKPPQGKRANSLASLSPVTYSLTSLSAAESPLSQLLRTLDGRGTEKPEGKL